jgi:tRNA A58 N-methylase Trm61
MFSNGFDVLIYKKIYFDILKKLERSGEFTVPLDIFYCGRE